MKVIPRSNWTSVVPKIVTGAEDFTGTPNFRSIEVSGISIVTPDEAVKFVELSPFAYFEGERKIAFSQKGFGDIAFNLGVAPNVDGIFCLRGLCNKPATNKEFNSTHISILCLLGREEPPTDLLINNLLACRSLVLGKYPEATEIRNKVPILNDIWDTGLRPVSSQFTCTLPEPFSVSMDTSSVQVFDLIEFLSYYNYYKARNDGVYGPICTQAVRELQADLILGSFYRKRVDGLYGRYTKDAACNWLRTL